MAESAHIFESSSLSSYKEILYFNPVLLSFKSSFSPSVINSCSNK